MGLSQISVFKNFKKTSKPKKNCWQGSNSSISSKFFMYSLPLFLFIVGIFSVKEFTFVKDRRGGWNGAFHFKIG